MYGLTVEDGRFLLLKLLVELADEAVELYLLILSELYCEYLICDSVLVLVVALPGNVIDSRLQVLFYQLFLYLSAGR
jgi:hypothetical protein